MVLSIAIWQSQFNTSHLFAHIFCSIWPIDRSLSGSTTPGQNEPGSNDNEGVLHSPQIFKAGTSPSDGLISYQGHTLGSSYTSTVMQLVCSTNPANWAWDIKFSYLIQQIWTLQYVSSSSCRAAGTDIPDLLSPLLPIVHRFWQVFRATSRILI